jgi:hypothetical protein
VVGILTIAYQGITLTKREKTINLGPVNITTDKAKALPQPQIIGVVALVGGAVLLIIERNRG